jgi:hypothetical protein
VEDHSEQKARLLAAAHEQAAARREAADELRSVADRFGRVRLSAPAMALLLELLTAALGNSTLRWADPPAPHGFGLQEAHAVEAELDLRLTLRRVPGRTTVLRSVDGDLAVDDVEIGITTAEVPGRGGAVEEVSA